MKKKEEEIGEILQRVDHYYLLLNFIRILALFNNTLTEMTRSARRALPRLVHCRRSRAEFLEASRSRGAHFAVASLIRWMSGGGAGETTTSKKLRRSAGRVS